MTRAIRMVVLMVGLICSFAAVTVPASALDGAPPPYCDPNPGVPCR